MNKSVNPFVYQRILENDIPKILYDSRNSAIESLTNDNLNFWGFCCHFRGFLSFLGCFFL